MQSGISFCFLEQDGGIEWQVNKQQDNNSKRQNAKFFTTVAFVRHLRHVQMVNITRETEVV